MKKIRYAVEHKTLPAVDLLVKEAEKKQAEVNIEVAEARLNQAELDLSYTQARIDRVMCGRPLRCKENLT